MSFCIFIRCKLKRSLLLFAGLDWRIPPGGMRVNVIPYPVIEQLLTAYFPGGGTNITCKRTVKEIL